MKIRLNWSWIVFFGVFIIGMVIGYYAKKSVVKSEQGLKQESVRVKKDAFGCISGNWKKQSNVVAYVLPNVGPYYDLKWSGIKEELEHLGYEPQKYTAGGYKNIKKQTDILENLIQKKVAGIILHPASDTAVVPFVERAYDAGIPVIAENVNIASDLIAGRVMLANYQNGWELAMALVQLLKGKGKIAALIGPPGQEQAAAMWDAAQEYFLKFPEIKVIREEYLPANSPDALKRVENILSSHQDIDGIYTWYVQNAVGAAEAVRQAKISPNKIFIVAKDINSQGEELLKMGYIHYLLVGEPISMGRNSARLMDAILKGRATNCNIILRNRLVDISTLSLIDRSGFEHTPD